MTKRMTHTAAARCAAVYLSENILETAYQQMLGEAAEFRFAAMCFVKYTVAIQWTMLTPCVLPTTRPALTSAAVPTHCARRSRRPSADRPARRAACLASRRYRAGFAAA